MKCSMPHFLAIRKTVYREQLNAYLPFKILLRRVPAVILLCAVFSAHIAALHVPF